MEVSFLLLYYSPVLFWSSKSNVFLMLNRFRNFEISAARMAIICGSFTKVSGSDVLRFCGVCLNNVIEHSDVMFLLCPFCRCFHEGRWGKILYAYLIGCKCHFLLVDFIWDSSERISWIMAVCFD